VFTGLKMANYLYSYGDKGQQLAIFKPVNTQQFNYFRYSLGPHQRKTLERIAKITV
jgi:hypothetical protein